MERAAWWNPRVRRILKAAPLVVMFLLLNARPARSSCSFNPTPDPTADGSSNSLRHAIQSANASGQDCVIQLQAGTYTLSIKNTHGQENAAAEGDLDITDSGHTVMIKGRGAGVSIVNGNGSTGIDDRVFHVLGGANAVLSNLTIEGGIAHDNGSAGALPGSTESDGGGVLVQDSGHVTLSSVTVKGNQALGGNGVNGVCIRPSLPLFTPGTPGLAAAGGGLFLASGAVQLTDAILSGNGAIGGDGGAGPYCLFADTAPVGTSGKGGGTGAGGGLYVFSGNTTLVTSTLSENTAAGGSGGHGGFGTGGVGGLGAGGGLDVLSGKAQLSKSTVSGNHASGAQGGPGECPGCLADPFAGGNGGAAQGAGLFIAAGALGLRQTTVSANSATGGMGGGETSYFTGRGTGAGGGSSLGAGIFVGNGDISLANSTFFANQAKGGAAGVVFCTPCTKAGQGGDAAGGGLYLSAGSISLTGDSVASNQALTRVETVNPGSSLGGGIANAGATSLVTNTTLIGNNSQDSGNNSNGDDVSGPITCSYSLIGQTDGASITNDGGNIFNVNPGLDPNGLQFNGGPTQTVALEDRSPADGTGDNAICKDAAPTGLGGIDQRGRARFRHGDNLCDIGAFEFITLFIQPTSLSFGSEPVGHQTRSQAVSVTNNQTASVALSKSIGGTNPGAFRIVGTTCGETLAPDTSCTIAIAFKPGVAGKRLALLTVSDSPDRTSPYQVALIGVGQ